MINEWLANEKVNIIWGAGIDNSLGEQIKVSVLLAG